MATQRRAILISPPDDQILRELYRQYRIPSDQYKRRPRDLQRFVSAWNQLTNRSDCASDLLHYIVTQRKQKVKDWPKLGNAHLRLARLPDDFLSIREWAILEAIYREQLIPQEIGSDALAFDDLLAGQLAREFYDRAGRSVPGRLLFAAIMMKRKRGEWVKFRPAKDGGIGFSDIDDIAV